MYCALLNLPVTLLNSFVFGDKDLDPVEAPVWPPRVLPGIAVTQDVSRVLGAPLVLGDQRPAIWGQQTHVLPFHKDECPCFLSLYLCGKKNDNCSNELFGFLKTELCFVPFLCRLIIKTEFLPTKYRGYMLPLSQVR